MSETDNMPRPFPFLEGLAIYLPHPLQTHVNDSTTFSSPTEWSMTFNGLSPVTALLTNPFGTRSASVGPSPG